MVMGTDGAYGCSHWVGGGTAPRVGRLSILGDGQIYSKMTNARMSLKFIRASSHVLSWQLCSSGGFTAARSKTLKTAVHCLVSKLRVPMRSTTAIYSLKWFRKSPLLLAKCLFYEAQYCNSVTGVFYFFFFQFDLTANYICTTFTNFKVKQKPVERLLKGQEDRTLKMIIIMSF